MTKQVIVVRKDLNMRKGKIAAQVAHASLGVFSDRFTFISNDEGDAVELKCECTEVEYQWFMNSFTKICLGCDSEEDLIEIEQQAKSMNIPCILITDNGTTEFHGVPTKTCIAIGPAKSSVIDLITRRFKLL